MSGLIERDLERDRPVEESGMRRDVADPFVDVDKGDIIDREEVVDALDMLRSLRPGSFGPAGEGVRLYRGFAVCGPVTVEVVVSIASREYIGVEVPDRATI